MAVTIDAHCQDQTTEMVTNAGGQYVFTVKNNTPRLRADLKMFPDPGTRAWPPTSCVASSDPQDLDGGRPTWITLPCAAQ